MYCDLHLQITLVKHSLCTLVHFAKHFSQVITTILQPKEIQRRQETLRKCFTLNYDLDFVPTWVNHAPCTPAYYAHY